MGNTTIQGVMVNGVVVPVRVDADGHIMMDIQSIPTTDVRVVSMSPLVDSSADIGTVRISSLPSIPAGSALIGKIDVNTIPALVAGAARIGSVGHEGYYSGAWQKAPIPFGASADYGLAWQNLSLPAGNSNQDGGALTANNFTVITNWAVKYVGTITNVYLDLVRMDGGSGGTARQVMGWKIATSNIWYYWTGSIVCKASDILRVVVTGATLNDDLYSSVNGYRYALNL